MSAEQSTTSSGEGRAASGPVLHVKGVEVRYGRRRPPVPRGVSLDVSPGETVGLIGETGSGKSTLARAVLGLVPLSAGSVTIGSEETRGLGRRQWRRLRRSGIVQYVFQDPLRSLDPDLTVGESLTEPLLVQGVTATEATERARALLDQVRLPAGLLGRLPGELSGGQRQRVAVARALVTEPRLVILDEPVSALDCANRVQILEILKDLRARGTALLLISHDLGSVVGVADRTAVLYQGELVESGPSAEVVNRPRHAYTRLLVSSAPTLHGASADRAAREALRAQLTDLSH